MVKNLSYSFELPPEWWSICDYADGLCAFSKIPKLFYEVCMNGKCSFKNYRKLSEFFPTKKELQIMDLTRKILGD